MDCVRELLSSLMKKPVPGYLIDSYNTEFIVNLHFTFSATTFVLQTCFVIAAVMVIVVTVLVVKHVTVSPVSLHLHQ